MLIGEYEHSLDTKGRLIMPAKLREDIGEKFIITKGLDGCLFAFSIEEWKNDDGKQDKLYYYSQIIRPSSITVYSTGREGNK